MRNPLFWLCMLPLLGGASQAPNPASPEEGSALFGRITLATSRGAVPGLGSVVWLPNVRSARHSEEPKIVSRGKRFEPHVLAVEAGTRVLFPNVDQVYHNVFSLSPPNAFDLGLYRKGAVPSVQFRTSGLVRIYCNIHPDMAAYVMVLDSSAFAVAGPDGAFRIPGVPPGRYAVKVWNERGGEQEGTVEFESGRDKEYSIELDASTYHALPHKNKHGKDYPPVANEDRY